jgi:hypothetical protein
MESQQDNCEFFNNGEMLFSKKVIYWALGIVSLLTLLGFLLFGTISTDLSCIRSPLNSIECNLIRNTTLLRMSPIKILDPLAVDVIIRHHRRVTFYTAEIRMPNVSYTLPIISTYNYKSAQDTADTVNTFLLKSKSVSFSKRFPEKIK